MSIKITSKKFKERAALVHNNKYDYSKSIYVNAITPVSIICPIHGIFKQQPFKHLQGQKCPTCAGRPKYTNATFIEKSNEIYDSKFKYDKLNYIDAHTNVTIICPVHGEFKQSATQHLSGVGCQECNKTARILKTKESFVIKANKIHHNKYDYSKTFYEKSNNKIKIICPEHGEFEQLARGHLSGQGCPKCKTLSFSKTAWKNICIKDYKNDPRVYIVRFYNLTEQFIKIGITAKSFIKRFKNIPYSYEVLKEIKGSPDFVWDKEKELHKLYKSFKYKPKLKFNGCTECFSLEILNLLS